MTTKTNNAGVPELAEAIKTTADPEISDSRKKDFVEPQISAPVDVLEATTFFITGDSAPTET